MNVIRGTNTNGVYRNVKLSKKKWTESLDEYRVFGWLQLENRNFCYDAQVEKTVQYLLDKNIHIDDSQLFNQIVNLKKFLGNQPNVFFEQSSSAKCFSEILKIVQFFFAIPAHSANCERVFSLMNSQWLDERNRFSVENVKHILIVQFNFSNMSCHDI